MLLPEKIKGAVFDLDGTLLDSLGVWSDVDRKFFAKRNIPMPQDYFEKIKALDLRDAARYTKARFSLPDAESSLVDEWLGLVGEEYRSHVCAKPAAAEYLRYLASRGTGLAIATSSSPALFLPALERLGIGGLFSAFVTTRDVARGKDFPDVYFEAARRLGLPASECAVFEDILAGVRSANAGGFFSVAVYDESSSSEKEALAREADLFVHGFGELLPR